MTLSGSQHGSQDKISGHWRENREGGARNGVAEGGGERLWQVIEFDGGEITRV